MRFSSRVTVLSSIIALQTATLAHHAMASQPGTVKNLRQQFESSSTQSNPQPASRAGGIGSLLSSTDIPALTAARDRYPVGSELYNRYDKRIKILEAQNKPKLDPKMQAKIEEMQRRADKAITAAAERQILIKDTVKKEYQDPLLKENRMLLRQEVDANTILKGLYRKIAAGQTVRDEEIRKAMDDLKHIGDQLDQLSAKVDYFSTSHEKDTSYEKGLKYLEDSRKQVDNLLDEAQKAGISSAEITDNKTLHERILSEMKSVADQRMELRKINDKWVLGAEEGSSVDMEKMIVKENQLIEKMNSLAQKEKRLYDILKGQIEVAKEEHELNKTSSPPPAEPPKAPEVTTSSQAPSTPEEATAIQYLHDKDIQPKRPHNQFTDRYQLLSYGDRVKATEYLQTNPGGKLRNKIANPIPAQIWAVAYLQTPLSGAKVLGNNTNPTNAEIQAIMLFQTYKSGIGNSGDPTIEQFNAALSAPNYKIMRTIVWGIQRGFGSQPAGTIPAAVIQIDRLGIDFYDFEIIWEKKGNTWPSDVKLFGKNGPGSNGTTHFQSPVNLSETDKSEDSLFVLSGLEASKTNPQMNDIKDFIRFSGFESEPKDIG